MNGRGLATPAVIGLVLLVGGLALVDSLRGCETTTTRVTPTTPTVTEEPPPTTTTTGTGPAPQEDAPADWPQGELRGVLTYVDAADCRIRTIGLTSGRPRPPTRFVTDCRGFWAPKVGTHLAFGEVLSEGFFRVANLAHPGDDFGSFPIGASTAPLWSPDGLRLAWCDSPNTGVELEMLGDGRLLEFCPIAYTLDERLARAASRGLAVGATTVVSTGTPVTWARFGTGDSVVIGSEGLLERFVGGASTASIDLPVDWTGSAPVVSPDTCLVAVPTTLGFAVFSLCDPRVVAQIPGFSAAWSPDGEWLAVGGEDGIVFTRFAGEQLGERLQWPATAAQLEWRG